MKDSLVQRIWHFVFGYHYFAVVSYRVGTFALGLHSNILTSRSQARKLLLDNQTFHQFEIVSFWSRHRYIPDADDSSCHLPSNEFERQ